MSKTSLSIFITEELLLCKLPVLFIPLISCFSISQLNVILVPMPFVLLLLLFGTCYLILPELLLLYIPLNVFSKLTISSLPLQNPLLAVHTRATHSVIDTGV